MKLVVTTAMIAPTARTVVQSDMAKRQLSVVAGAVSRSLKPKGAPAQDALAKRWRAALPQGSPEPPELPAVISLMDAWIRRLEREANGGTLPQAR